MIPPFSLSNSASLVDMLLGINIPPNRSLFLEREKIEGWSAAIYCANNFDELFDILKMIPDTNAPFSEWKASSAHKFLQKRLFDFNVGQFKEIFRWMQGNLNDIVKQGLEHPDNITPLYFLFNELEESLESKRIEHNFGDDQFNRECFYPLEERFKDLFAAGLIHGRCYESDCPPSQ